MAVAAKKQAADPDTLPAFLDVGEFAGLMRVSKDQAYVMLQSGKIPGAKKLGGTWRINKQVLIDSFSGNSRASKR